MIAELAPTIASTETKTFAGVFGSEEEAELFAPTALAEVLTRAVGLVGAVVSNAVLGAALGEAGDFAVTEAWKTLRDAWKWPSPAKAIVTFSVEGCPDSGIVRLAAKAPFSSVTPNVESPPKSHEMSTLAESIGAPDDVSFPDTDSTPPASIGFGDNAAVMFDNTDELVGSVVFGSAADCAVVIAGGGACVVGAWLVGVLVAGWLSEKLTLALDGLNFESPAYVAVTMCEPAAGRLDIAE